MNVRLPLCVCALFSAALATSSAQTVHVVQTTADLTQALTPQPDLHFRKDKTHDAGSVEVDDKQRFQTIDGFGAAMVEGSAWLLHEKLSAEDRDAVMTKLFDPHTGAGLSFLRLPIASTDLSRTHYSYDDMPTGRQDPQMDHFSMEKDAVDVLPMMRQALKINPHITVMATPWSPPAWMKTTSTMDGGALRPDAEPAFASYLVRSLQAFEQAGIPVKFLSVQNEPLNEKKDFPTTLMLADQQMRFIGHDLGPALHQAGLKTQVLAYDHNWDHPEYPLSVLADPASRPYMAGSAMHCYGGRVETQDGMHAAEPDMGIWMTECSGGNWQTEPPLASTARLLISATRHWAKAVVLWGIALQPDGNPHAGGCGTCRGLLTIDTNQDKPKITWNGDYYALAQASKYVQPGATRIASSGEQDIQNVAFENTDRSLALLVYNTGVSTRTFGVRWDARTVSLTLPSGSLATLTWRPY